jgi:hypothetical protein
VLPRFKQIAAHAVRIKGRLRCASAINWWPGMLQRETDRYDVEVEQTSTVKGKTRRGECGRNRRACEVSADYSEKLVDDVFSIRACG